jgi:hypothetical protein
MDTGVGAGDEWVSEEGAESGRWCGEGKERKGKMERS